MRGMLFLPRVVLTTGKRHSSVTGLQKPASSHSHAGCSHLLWAPAILCMLAGKTQREKNRYYVKSVGGGVKFLCVNEFRLCGTTETLKVNLVVWIYLRKRTTSKLILLYQKNAKNTSRILQYNWNTGKTWFLERTGKGMQMTDSAWKVMGL